MGKHWNVFAGHHWETQWEKVKDLNKYELEDLEEAIYLRRLELYAEWLRHYGIQSRLDCSVGRFRYLLVYPPAEVGGLNVWATPAECQNLLDRLANLPPAEAFRRWVQQTVEPLEVPPYTEDDARADMQAERAQLREDYHQGKIDASEFRQLWRDTHDYLRIAKELQDEQ